MGSQNGFDHHSQLSTCTNQRQNLSCSFAWSASPSVRVAPEKCLPSDVASKGTLNQTTALPQMPNGPLVNSCLLIVCQSSESNSLSSFKLLSQRPVATILATKSKHWHNNDNKNQQATTHPPTHPPNQQTNKQTSNKQQVK